MTRVRVPVNPRDPSDPRECLIFLLVTASETVLRDHSKISRHLK